MSAVRPAPLAFDDFYRENYRSMVFLARATTQSVGMAEEIVQDAFVQLYQRWDQVGEPRAWLRRAVLSLCTSWVRRTVRARSVPMIALDESRHDLDASLDIWCALSRLPPRQRAAVVLRYVEDLSERDIAHALGCRMGTVKSTLSRARQTLRSELTDDRD
ncbi:MAG: hypothetical protein DLM57_04460 [Pseudonocardiales bacterium]|nr:MAG: hypothetical protein DLM57_04460 [Pseudonocardiales bacterium]